jgi:ADP-ribose pyrophosphatase YjhB (NUDIX family)
MLRLLLWNLPAVGMLSTPGGRIEEDEDMIDAAIRETQEETGLKLDAEDVKIIGFKEHFRFGSHYFMFYAEVRRWTGTLTNTEPNKCKSWEWFAVSAIPDNCTEPKDILATCAAAPAAPLPQPSTQVMARPERSECSESNLATNQTRLEYEAHEPESVKDGYSPTQVAAERRPAKAGE